MLKKLIKYDLKYVFKILIVFYLLSLFFALLTRIFFSIENSFLFNVIAQITSGVTISMIFNILINNLMRLWSRFKNNFYSDESYLTHTLPIDKKTLYLSKILTVISLFLSFLVITLTLFIAYYSNSLIESIKSILLPLANVYNSSVIIILLTFIFILFLEFSNILQCGFTGLILGHKKNNNKLAYSVLYSFITFIVSQMFVLLTTFILALFNKDILNLIYTKEVISIESTKIIIYFSIVLYTIILIILNFINIKLFKQGVNVE